MQLIVITPETDLPGETSAANLLLHMGLYKLHIRKPEYDTRAYRDYINRIDPAYHGQLVIHGAYELFADTGIGGIHLRSALRDDSDTLRAIVDIPYSSISTSYHSWGELLQGGGTYGSAFISPIFDSISKTGYKAAVSIEGIIQAKTYFREAGKRKPFITGLGGIDRNNIMTLKNHGYDGAALLGAIWNTPDPIASFAAIQAVINGKG